MVLHSSVGISFFSSILDQHISKVIIFGPFPFYFYSIAASRLSIFNLDLTAAQYSLHFNTSI